ncbi:MAG: glutamate racemase [Acidobacteriota bacterium]|nr:glutamate racemase [Acidobacteriota bacterium]
MSVRQPETSRSERPACERPIGVFDSGVGGLTVVAALERRLPGEAILYLGDTARLPYGTKSEETVTRYTQRNLDFLAHRGVKAMVVACNTASALALPRLSPQLPTWGVVEPGARAAVEHSTSGRIGVIGTESTIRSDAYGQAIRRHRPEAQVSSSSCPLFVPLVEEGWLDDSVVEEVARRYTGSLREAGIDTLVLGCTHYPMLRPVLQRVMGPDVGLVDSAETTAEAVAVGLAERGLLAGDSAGSRDHGDPERHLCVTDASQPFARVADLILGAHHRPLELVEV